MINFLLFIGYIVWSIWLFKPETYDTNPEIAQLTQSYTYKAVIWIMVTVAFVSFWALQ